MKHEVLQFEVQGASNDLGQQGSGLTCTQEKPSTTLEKVGSSVGTWEPS